MDNFTQAKKAMTEFFGRDYQFSLATVNNNNVPSQRFVDTYFDGEFFYVAAYALSQKVKEIAVNPNVSLCSRKIHSFSGKAYNIGHPLKPENAQVREKLIAAFEPWYFLHNNEADENMCYIRITPISGFFHKDGMGYSLDFENKTADIVPFVLNVLFTED